MKPKLKLVELVIFALLGALMLAGDVLMDAIPNVHLVAVLLTSYTVVYRAKALFPLYVYVFLIGLTAGFASWWVPYLYVWTVLWGAVMLLPRDLSPRLSVVLYGGVTMLHGLCFNVLYLPGQLLVFPMPAEMIPIWLIKGLPFDVIHGIGNAALSVLILPIVTALRRGNKLLK